MLELRTYVEFLTVKLVMERASDEEIASLLPFLVILRETKDNKTAAQASFDFHHRMAALTQNTLCPLIYYSLRPDVLSLWERYCRLYGQMHWWNVSSKIPLKTPHRSIQMTPIKWRRHFYMTTKTERTLVH